MNVNSEWVAIHKEEIEREAHRIYKLRETCHVLNNSYDNFITAITNVWIRYERSKSSNSIT